MFGLASFYGDQIRIIKIPEIRKFLEISHLYLSYSKERIRALLMCGAILVAERAAYSPYIPPERAHTVPVVAVIVVDCTIVVDTANVASCSVYPSRLIQSDFRHEKVILLISLISPTHLSLVAALIRFLCKLYWVRLCNFTQSEITLVFRLKRTHLLRSLFAGVVFASIELQ